MNNLVILSALTLATAFEIGSFTDRSINRTIKTDENLSRFGMVLTDDSENVQFVIDDKDDIRSSIGDNVLDILAIIDLGDGRMVLALDRFNYTQAQLERIFAAARMRTKGQRTSEAMNALVSREKYSVFYGEKTDDDTWSQIIDVTARCQGLDLFNDKKLVLKTRGFAYVIEDEALIAYLVGEFVPQVMKKRGLFVSQDAKLTAIEGTIAFIQQGELFLFNEDHELLACQNVRADYLKGSIGKDGRLNLGNLVIFRKVDGGHTSSRTGITPNDMFGANAAMLDAFERRQIG